MEIELAYREFDKYAEKYDLWYEKNKVIFECESKVVKALDLHGKGLSIGVGTGILDFYAPIDVGVDPSVNMLKHAKARGIKPVRAVGEFLPFRDESFDFVIMIATLCFLVSPKETIREAWRIMHSRGELAVCIIPRESSWGKEYVKKGEAGHALYKYARFYTLNEVKDMLNETSFTIVSIKSTLSYSPRDEPRVENPSDNPEGKGFICIKAIKNNMIRSRDEIHKVLAK